MAKYVMGTLIAMLVLIPPILGLELIYRVIIWIRKQRRF